MFASNAGLAAILACMPLGDESCRHGFELSERKHCKSKLRCRNLQCGIPSLPFQTFSSIQTWLCNSESRGQLQFF